MDPAPGACEPWRVSVQPAVTLAVQAADPDGTSLWVIALLLILAAIAAVAVLVALYRAAARD